MENEQRERERERERNINFWTLCLFVLLYGVPCFEITPLFPEPVQSSAIYEMKKQNEIIDERREIKRKKLEVLEIANCVTTGVIGQTS